MKFTPLQSADASPWTDAVSTKDGLPIRESGSWIDEKHRNLVYFATIFAKSMKPTAYKAGWPHRVYLELFSGPGRCLVRETGKEEDGSPLKVQIKATFKGHLSFGATPDYYLGFKLYPDGRYEEVYNGPGKPIFDRYAHRAGIGTKLLSFPVKDLRLISAEVPGDLRVPLRSKPALAP